LTVSTAITASGASFVFYYSRFGVTGAAHLVTDTAAGDIRTAPSGKAVDDFDNF